MTTWLAQDYTRDLTEEDRNPGCVSAILVLYTCEAMLMEVECSLLSHAHGS